VFILCFFASWSYGLSPVTFISHSNQTPERIITEGSISMIKSLNEMSVNLYMSLVDYFILRSQMVATLSLSCCKSRTGSQLPALVFQGQMVSFLNIEAQLVLFPERLCAHEKSVYDFARPSG
jgi:hypothetical protein